ncbi:MAG: PaaI family thioesterase [Atopobiaceae bacterium]|jgi:acyl-CoA thioesterase|nr:PaaI family thioesterase [Atopobiaceae bacterium]
MGDREPLLPDDATLEQVSAFFERDRFATESCHPRVVEASHGHSAVTMDILEGHLNGMGNLMGGVAFTLADYAFAIASNIGQAPTVSASANVDFMGRARGTRLVATCDLERDGRTLCFATVRVSDDAGVDVARISFVGCRQR